MALEIRTLVAVAVGGQLVRKGTGSVSLVNKHATVAMRVATSQARLGAAATRDEIEAGGVLEVNMSARKDELWVGAASATIDVAVYEA